MSVAVVIAAIGDGDPVEMERLDQSRDLWRRLGMAVDLLLVSADQGARFPPIHMSMFRRIGSIRGGVMSRDRSSLNQLLLRMNDGAPYAAAHGIGIGMRPAPSAAGVFVAETSGTGPAGFADLVLARTEEQRVAVATAGCRAVRLPLRRSRPGPALRGRAVGWIGNWSPDRVAAWNRILCRWSRQGADPSEGIVLCGPGAEGIAIPDNLAHRTCTGPTIGHLSVLSLLAAPDPPVAADYTVISTALSLRRPVLVGPRGAEIYDDRWRLPVFDGAEGLCELVAAWSVNDQVFASRLDATRQAFERDLAAMTDHVLRELATLVPVAFAGRSLPVSRPSGHRIR